jgi:hypothetical protein
MVYLMKVSLFILVASVAFLIGCASSVAQKERVPGASKTESLVKYQADGWYVSPPLNIEEIERQAMEECREYQRSSNARTDVPMVPFGFDNGKWLEFKGKVKPGDEIRRISAPNEYWQRLAGWEGYVLVRGGLIVWKMRTLVN